MREVGLKRGAKVADIGAGSGYFTLAAAEMVGEEGIVIAVEPDPERMGTIAKRVKKEGRSNVRVVASKAEDMNEVVDGAAGIAFSMYSLHHFENKERALAEVRRILRPGGTFYVRDIVRGLIFRHGTRREEVALLKGAGFSNFELLSLGRILRVRLTK